MEEYKKISKGEEVFYLDDPVNGHWKIGEYVMFDLSTHKHYVLSSEKEAEELDDKYVLKYKHE